MLAAFVELMGLRAKPARLEVVLGEKPGAFAQVCQIIREQGGDISGFFTARGRYDGEGLRVLVIRLKARDVEEVIRAVGDAGHRVLSASLRGWPRALRRDGSSRWALRLTGAPRHSPGYRVREGGW